MKARRMSGFPPIERDGRRFELFWVEPVGTRGVTIWAHDPKHAVHLVESLLDQAIDSGEWEL